MKKEQKNLTIIITLVLVSTFAYFIYNNYQKQEIVPEKKEYKKTPPKKPKKIIKKSFDDTYRAPKTKKDSEQKKEKIEKVETKLEKSPQLEKISSQMKGMLSNILDQTYADFFNDLSLTPEKKKEVSDYLVENQLILQETIMDLMNDDLSDEEILAKQELYAKAQKQAVNNILDPDEQEKLETYQKELPVRTGKKFITNIFDFGGKNTNEEEKEAITKIYLRVSAEQNGVPTSLSQQARNAPGWLTKENMPTTREYMNKQKNPNNLKDLKDRQKSINEETARQALNELGIEVKPFSNP